MKNLGKNTDDHLKILKSFHSKAAELRESALLKKRFSTKLTIKMNQINGFSMEVQEPDETDLRSYLLSFRQFFLDGEPVFLNRVYNICLMHLKHEPYKKYLVKSREIWKHTFRQAGIPLLIDNKEISPEYAMKLFLYGHYFHTDSEKAEALSALLPHEYIFTRHLFLDFVLTATRQILYVDNIVSDALKRDLFA